MTDPRPNVYSDRCVAVVPRAKSKPDAAGNFDVEFEQCQDKKPPNHVLCPEHWGKLPNEYRRTVIQIQVSEKKNGARKHTAKWRDAVNLALQALCKKLVDEMLTEVKRVNGHECSDACVHGGGTSADANGEQHVRVPDGASEAGEGPAPSNVGGDEPGPESFDGS